MNSKELMQKYQQLLSAPLDAPSMSNESGESVKILFQTSSIRILLVRTTQAPKIVSIEVEIWLPGRNVDSLSSEHNNRSVVPAQDLGKTLSQLIKSLQYLHKLHESGFTLDVIRHDCLWIASRRFKNSPSLETFQLLLPP